MKNKFGMMLVLISLLFLAGMSDVVAWAAPCCARSSATPSLIVGDDRAQVNFGFSVIAAVADANSSGVMVYNGDQSDFSYATRLDGATLLSDRLQLAAGTSFVSHQVSNGTASATANGIGDTRVSLSYELLPIWNYSPWKPQVFVFSSVALPTGHSKYDDPTPLNSGINGNGFYSVSTGALIVKKWSQTDLFFLPEIHYGLPRHFQNSYGSTDVEAGFGGSLGLGGGWSPGGGNLRIGLRLQPKVDRPTYANYNGKVWQTKGNLSAFDTGLDLAYLVSANDSVMFSYTDQTLIQMAANMNVNRVAALTLQHRWER